jgi:hypothetical protein
MSETTETTRTIICSNCGANAYDHLGVQVAAMCPMEFTVDDDGAIYAELDLERAMPGDFDVDVENDTFECLNCGAQDVKPVVAGTEGLDAA